MVVAIGLAAVAQPLQSGGERGVIRDDGAAVAERGEVLGRIKS